MAAICLGRNELKKHIGYNIITHTANFDIQREIAKMGQEVAISI